MTAVAAGPDPTVEIGQRLVSEEPMALVFNLGLSSASTTYPETCFAWKLTRLRSSYSIREFPVRQPGDVGVPSQALLRLCEGVPEEGLDQRRM